MQQTPFGLAELVHCGLGTHETQLRRLRHIYPGRTYVKVYGPTDESEEYWLLFPVDSPAAAVVATERRLRLR